MNCLIECYIVDIEANKISKIFIPDFYEKYFQKNGMFSLYQYQWYSRTLETAIEFLRDKNSEIVTEKIEQITKLTEEMNKRNNIAFEGC